MMHITTYKGFEVLYDRGSNTWEAWDFKGNALFEEPLPSLVALEKAVDKIDRKNNPEKYGDKPQKIPAFIMEYDEKIQNVVVTSEAQDSYGEELWVSNGKKHWKHNKTEVFYDTPENRKIVAEITEVERQISSLENMKNKIEKRLKRFK